MNSAVHPRRLAVEELELILSVTRALAAPFALHDLLGEIAQAACRVLHAERASVWLLDATGETLVLEAARDLDAARLPLGRGLIGACARDRQLINVPDCYADPRFNPEIDRRTGFRTRCSLTLPLADHDGTLVGVMQVLNRHGCAFDARDEALALALAAQCAVAIERVHATQALVASERLRQELELARKVQLHALPSSMPEVDGYDLHAWFLPASITGGDTYDVARIGSDVLLVLGDAAGHGFAPALSVTQMHAMLRMAFRMGADLETAFRQVNDQLTTTLADSRFVTAFIGLLDPQTHRLRFLSGGQGPVLHLQRATRSCVHRKATSFPMGAMTMPATKPAAQLDLAPGDVLALMTDGVFEAERTDGVQLGVGRIEQLLLDHLDDDAQALGARVIDAVRDHADGAGQADDITVVIVKRRA